MKQDRMYRWSITPKNSVYNFCMFHGDGFNASTLASYKNEVSGFIKKSNVRKLIAALVIFGGYEFLNLKLVTTDTFWANYDKYNN